MKGGARPGAGRPKGSFNKPQIRDFFLKEEIEAYVEDWKKRALTNDRIFIALGEQIFGKPRQNVGLDGGEDGLPVQINSVKELSDDELAAIAYGSAAGASQA